jgi:hypothetical protein
MNVQQLSLRQFTAFDAETRFEFCPGINVLIGANSTGKSHVLKAIYTLLKLSEKAQSGVRVPSQQIRDAGQAGKVESNGRLEALAYDKLFGVFKPERVSRLVRHGQGNRGGFIELEVAGGSLRVEITSQDNLSVQFQGLPTPLSSVFLPVHEFLSIYEGFIAAYEQRETAFDETYYDLAVALNARPLRGPKLEQVRSLVAPLEKAIGGGKVTQENGRFYVKLPEARLEAQLVSEGYRKLATLIYLLNNGSLAPNGVLLWDEPEANLNPRMVTSVVKVLQILAGAGVQVFVATHDYLISQELSLLAEYPSETPVRFFALYQPRRGAGVEVESGNSLAEIGKNPILEEYAAFYEREEKFFTNGHKD